MRGHDTPQAGMFSYLSPEERIPATHPLRPISLVPPVSLAMTDRFCYIYSHR